MHFRLTLDFNPLHFDSKCAKDAGFTDPLVPGMLVASFFPGVVASYFPGAVYVSESLHFKNPVYIGEEINAEIQATMIREMRKQNSHPNALKMAAHLLLMAKLLQFYLP
ncbi:hypothetical protein M9H77_16188 [Catharanthus roseus]|uniref:Uncharacterized protein n=1 Tax=Catharanthus roseus TaxID=4058 RepID=A0ACC0B0P5_CATRO|nr:hypothetical protein M9H77_16188 [Catharanthus roseus]